MKALGIGITLEGSSVVLSVTKPSRAEDTIWEAVEEALCAGLSVEQFRREAATAWDYTIKQRAKDDAKVWNK